MGLGLLLESAGGRDDLGALVAADGNAGTVVWRKGSVRLLLG
jgi:hypothetical protein